MAIPHYLAMTAAEISTAPSLPAHTAWMACHFSPYSTGLTNLPAQLPEGSLLILNDRTPIHRHDPERIAQELESILTQFHCSGLLLDFQNPPTEESRDFAARLAEKIHVPLALSRDYSVEGAAVFLPPVPLDLGLKEYLAPWNGKSIWLETALDGKRIQLHPEGAVCSTFSPETGSACQEDEMLHCHYSIQADANAATFLLWRTKEDVDALLCEAEQLGVKCAVGLYQELG